MVMEVQKEVCPRIIETCSMDGSYLVATIEGGPIDLADARSFGPQTSTMQLKGMTKGAVLSDVYVACDSTAVLSSTSLIMKGKRAGRPPNQLSC